MKQFDFVRAANGELIRAMSIDVHPEDYADACDVIWTDGVTLTVTADHRVMVVRGADFSMRQQVN